MYEKDSVAGRNMKKHKIKLELEGLASKKYKVFYSQI